MSGTLAYRFDHVHIYCKDLAASERWFVEGLGAEVVSRSEGRGTTTVFLNLGGGRVILRGAYEGEEMLPAGPVRHGTDHLGLEVTDLDATAAELKRRGVRFVEEPHQFRPGVRISFVEGPDQVRVEILERRP